MAKKDYDKIHRTNMDVYARKIQAIYNSAIKEAASIGVTIHDFNPDKLFSFADYPITAARVEKLAKSLQNNIETVILNGTEHEWTLSNNKNNELARRVFGDSIGKLSKIQEQRYFSNNLDALSTFQKRKVAGLGLSQRVWKYTEQFKHEIELGIDIGLRDRLPATEMGRSLRDYLQNPDKLFRRVRDEHGVLRLSKAAKAYSPGRGVYRSFVRNAERLARTETNISYRTSDYERWQQFDFVVGIEIRRSNNRSCICPLCDSLAGKYPKDFKFTGWHPQCRCHAIPVLKSIEELSGDTQRIIAGQPTDGQSVNAVNQMPNGFTEWIEDNKGRFGANNTPYFIRDNYKDGKIADGLSFAGKSSDNIVVKSVKKIKTDAQIATIQKAWDERKEIVKQDKFGDINIATELSKLENQEFKDFVWYLASDKELKIDISGLTTINRKEAIEKLRKFWSNTSNDEYLDMSKVHFWIAQNRSMITPAQLKQIRWNSQGGGYIRNNNSFTINNSLRTGSKNVLTKDDLKTIKELDAVIKNNAIPEDMLLYRRVASDWVKNVLEFDPNKLPANDVLKKLNQSHKNISDKGFTSTSGILRDNFFKDRRYLLEIKVKKGTPAYISDNMMESEIILKRRQPLRLVKAERLSNGDYKLYCEAW